MRCYYTVHEGERIFIPMCYASLHQDDARYCTCQRPTEVRMASTEAKRELQDARKQIYRLERLLWNLTKHQAFKK